MGEKKRTIIRDFAHWLLILPIRLQCPLRLPVAVNWRRLIWLWRRLLSKHLWFRCSKCGCWVHMDVSIGSTYWGEEFAGGSARMIAECVSCTPRQRERRKDAHETD